MAVRNEKTMEKKRIPVRPHHGMCLAYFIGKGYSEGFSAHMEKMLHSGTGCVDPAGGFAGRDLQCVPESSVPYR